MRYETVESTIREARWHLQSSFMLTAQAVLEDHCKDCDEYHNYSLPYTCSFVVGIANKEEEAHKTQLQKI
jgi:hypothetical protein